MKNILIMICLYIVKDYNYEIASMLANETMIILSLVGTRLTYEIISKKIMKEIGEIIYEQIK